jgi:hypothetical protein
LVSAELNQVIEDSSYRHRREKPVRMPAHGVTSD